LSPVAIPVEQTGRGQALSEPDAGHDVLIGSRGRYQPLVDGALTSLWLARPSQVPITASRITGLAFLPLTAGIVTASTTSNIVLLPRTGPRPLVATGMTLGAVGMFLFARLTPTSGYAGHVLPSLVVLGLGFGLIFAPAISSATYGVAQRYAGVASAMVNTMQQVGGSIGTALLSTVAASSAASFARSHAPSASLAVRSAVHGYTTAFTVSGLIFVGAALLTGLLLPSGDLSQGGSTRRRALSRPAPPRNQQSLKQYAAAAEPSWRLALRRRPVTGQFRQRIGTVCQPYLRHT